MPELMYKAMTKQELADHLGVSRRTLNRWIERVDVAQLKEIGYKKRDHFLTPKIVSFFCAHFVY